MGIDLYFPNNTYEIFSHADPAASFALGAQADVRGRFSTAKQVDLETVWPPDTHPQGDYKEHVWHSAEFNFDYAQQANFWNTLLGLQGFSLK